MREAKRAKLPRRAAASGAVGETRGALLPTPADEVSEPGVQETVHERVVQHKQFRKESCHLTTSSPRAEFLKRAANRPSASMDSGLIKSLPFVCLSVCLFAAGDFDTRPLVRRKVAHKG